MVYLGLCHEIKENEKNMYKKIKTGIVMLVMLLSVILSSTFLVSADGPNYVYFATPPYSTYKPSGDYYFADEIYNESFINQSDGALLYESVNDDNDTTNLEWDALEKMTFDLSGQPLSGTISSVTLHAILKRSGGLAAQCGYKWLLNDTSTEWESAQYTDTTASFSEKTYVLATNPFTSSAWEWSDLTTLKAGIYQSYIASGRLLSVSEYWLTISTSSATGIDVTIGDNFRMDVFVNISQKIDTICIKNISYLPAGIVNYLADSDNERTTGYTQSGNLFNATILYQEPTSSSTHNSQGWVGGTGETASEHFLWAQKYTKNSSVYIAWLITWQAVSCGNATFTVQPYSGSWGSTAYNGTDVGTTYFTGYVRVHPQTPTSLTTTPIGASRIDLSWTKHTGGDKTLIRYKTGSNPTSVTDGSLLYNGTGTSTIDTNMSGGDHIYYSAWGWNNSVGYYSLSYDTADGETNNAPVLSSEDPADNSGNIDKDYPQVSVYISDGDGDTFDWTIHGPYITTSNANGASNGTKTAGFTGTLPYGTDIIWYVNVTDGTDWTNATYNFTVRDTYAPVPPTGFTATTYDRFRIDLTWTPANIDDYTYIEWSTASTWSRGAGNFLYNGTGTGTSHTSLDEGKTYYYQAWSYNATDNVYSTLYAEDYDTTTDDLQPILSNEDPEDLDTDIDKNYPGVSIDISDPEGDLMDWTIEVSNGDSNSGIGASNGTKYCALLNIPLSYGATITWWVNVTDGYEWTNETYTFTVRDEYEPSAPTGFEATVFSRFQIDLNWTKAFGNDKVVIIAKLGSPPTLGVDAEIYNGTGISYNDDGLDPNEHWYYKAYGWNETDEVYSSSYDSANATTTGNNPPNLFTNEIPENETDYISVYNRYLNVTVSDPESDHMWVYFYWGNDTSIAWVEIDSGQEASIYLPEWLAHSDAPSGTRKLSQYTWYAIAHDSYTQTQSDIYNFITSKAWDINEDGTISYNDGSKLVNVYGSTVVAGSIGSDINEDGVVSYLDASSFVSHYGITYYP